MFIIKRKKKASFQKTKYDLKKKKKGARILNKPNPRGTNNENIESHK